ncbi:MAG: GNAT family N-acetyltransferase [Promethearchaeota archaeon]
MSENIMDKDEIIIRNYRTSDYEATLEILRQLDKNFHIGLKEKQWKQSSGLRQFKPNLKRITLIAELKATNEVVGMGMIEAVKNPLGQYIGYLNNWATKKEYIGLQVGKILAKRAIKILRSWGCEAVRIIVAWGFPEKILEVFEETGFKPIQIVLENKFESE